MRGLLILAAIAGACGKVEFIPSPYTPQDIALRYSSDEDLTVLRWRITAEGDDAQGVSFDLRQSDGTWQPVRFDAAPYKSGMYACNGGTCAQLVLRGRYSPTSGLPSPLRAHSPDGFVVPGLAAGELVQVRPPIVVGAAFTTDNLTIDIGITDALLDGPLKRNFAMAVWPQGSGNCDGPLSADQPVTGTTAHATIAQPPTPEGRYCVSVHGTPADGGHFARFGAAALTHPETLGGTKNYVPDAEQAPVLLQLILDLAIADPMRCQQVRDMLLTTLRNACRTAAGGAFHEFALVDLAPDCQRNPGRDFNPSAVADAIKQYVHQNVTVVHNKAVLFYANNLASEVPPQLEADLASLPGQFAGDERVSTFYWGMTTPGATPQVTYDLPGVWTAIEDPNFAQSIQMVVMATLPFETQLHDDGTMIPLLDSATVAREQGGFLKICQASPPVQLAAGGTIVGTLDVGIDPAAPPGFFVSLPIKITVPHSSFAQDDVIVRWEICRRWCDHPFTNDAGLHLSSWRSASECVHSQ